MIIAHVNKFYFDDPSRGGGVGIYLDHIIRQQKDDGHNVHIFSTHHDGMRPSVDSIYASPSINVQHPGIRDVRRFLYNRDAKFLFERFLDAVRPDVVHLHTIYHHLSRSILDVLMQRKIHTVMTVHDFKLICPNYKLFTENDICRRCKPHRYSQAVLHSCLTPHIGGNILAAVEAHQTYRHQSYARAVSTFLVGSKFVSQELSEWGWDENRIRVLPLPVHVGDLPRKKIPHGAPLVVAARFTPEKGVLRFVQQAAQIRLPIEIYGSGPQRVLVESEIQRNGLSHIRLMGPVRHEEILHAMSKALAVVVPSLGFETFGYVALEAMALGVPVIGAARGALVEHLSESRGITYSPDDPLSLTRAVEKLHTEALEPMILEAQSYAKGHTFGKHMVGLYNAYRASYR